ncbi:MAG: Segregation and condensation protein B [Fimbriimonadaceae bacterium]|nr:Segregation and condensation protein B [Fimbriimonadaceae bacterium]
MTLRDRVLALLFVTDTPLSSGSLAETLEVDSETVERHLADLGHALAGAGPLMLVRVAGGYQLATKPEFADDVAKLLKPQRQRMSKSLMEVLAIVAYRQPITMAEIESVRGVQSDYGVRALLERRLIREVGRKRAPGRPLLYGTTQQFMHHFQLESLTELPAVMAPEPAGEEDELQSVN